MMHPSCLCLVNLNRYVSFDNKHKALQNESNYFWLIVKTYKEISL
jgi:hypothetical protein